MKLRVLLVEDNPMNRELVQTLFDVEGHEVIVAESARVFRRHVAEGLVPDIILMDILLPDGVGTDLLPEVRAVPALKDVPVLALTAQALSGDGARFLAAGFDGVITKPIDTRTFVGLILGFARKTNR